MHLFRQVEGIGEEVLAIKPLDSSNGRKRRCKMVTDEKLLGILIVLPLLKSTSNVCLSSTKVQMSNVLT